jgi:phosphoenolpyruvate-protein phosphotransferase
VTPSRALTLNAPLRGWCMPLAQVPDPVFAEAMAGDGVAIDPTGATLHAPCDGEIVPMKDARHAVTVRSDSGIDVLMHVGIDTVKLGGEGFSLRVSPGQRVRAGDLLLEFDLDLVARRAASATSPIVLASGGAILRRAEGQRIEVGEFLMEVEASSSGVQATQPDVAHVRRRFRIPFEHGLHVRPAALVAAALRPFSSEVAIVAHGRSANARSTVAMMSLGVHCGDGVEVRATGTDAVAALAALESLLEPESPRPETAAKPRAQAPRARRIQGVIASRGVAVGLAARLTHVEALVEEAGRGEAREATALREALGVVRDSLARLAKEAAGEQRSLLQAHAELAQDPELAREAADWIRQGKSAGYAWREATRSLAEVLGALGDARMRERAADLRDLENQVLRVLGGEPPHAARELPAHSILLAEDLLPSQLMSLDPARIAGICIARGGPTSHVAIIAAASGIPTLVAAGTEILDVPDGTPLVLDAEHGWLDIEPPQAQRDSAERAALERSQERSADLEAAQGPSATRDGVRVTVNANVATVEEARAAAANGADGCGLLRTELMFLERREPPDEAAQAAEYQRIAAALAGRPLNVRTLDVAGDKPIAYLPMPREENPALGLRGIRASLWRPDLLRTQLRAIMRVEPAGQCRILLPMVNEREELSAIRTVAAECASELGVRVPAIGIMVETPAAAMLAEQLAADADFLSIGTNDLSQYTLAIDRAHPQLGARLDALHPAVLRLIARVAEACRARGKSVSVCGALGSDVDALAILIGLGVHEVSATAAMIPRLKRTVRSLDAGACRALAARALEQETAAAVRGLAVSP